MFIKCNQSIILGIILLFVAVVSTNAQSKVVNGKVTVFNNLPLAKAEVSIKKSKKIVLTNADGTFEIECQEKDKITMRASGFRSAWVKVKNLNDSIKVNLVFGGTERDISSASRAGHMEKDKLIHAFEIMEAEEFSSAGFTSIVQMVKRKFPTVSVINGEFQMRGITSLSGSNAALIVLNGSISTMGTIESIAVENVKNIKVLKGPAAAVWGSQGANGVVLVNTK
jgi:TonB-dependent SusC/RagA subfamily outer membrane receptor